MSEVIRELVDALKPKGSTRSYRQGTVTAVNADFTVDVTIAGSTTSITGVKTLTSCAPRVGDGVWLSTDGQDLFALGTVAPAGRHVITPDGGLAVPLVNKTGSASVKGTIVVPSTTTDRAFAAAPTGSVNPIGVVYEAGVADGSECLVTISGLAYVLLVNNVTTSRGHVVTTSTTVVGRGENRDPSVIGATDHWRELGHYIEAVTGGTDKLALATLHFN